MQAVRRFVSDDPGVIADAGFGIAAAGLIAVAVWGSPRLIGSEAIAGPWWLLALLPLLLGVPLALRRRAPLLMWLATWAGIGLLCLSAHNSLRGLAFMFAVFAAAYSLGAHASFRRAIAGLILIAPLVAVISHKGELSPASFAGEGERVPARRPWHCRRCSSWHSGWLAFSSAPAGRPPRWPRGARRCSARPSRPQRPSGHGSPGNCTTSSPITSA